MDEKKYQRKVAMANELSAANARKRAADDKKEIAISDNVAAAAETSVVSALPPNEEDRDIPLHHMLIDQKYEKKKLEREKKDASPDIPDDDRKMPAVDDEEIAEAISLGFGTTKVIAAAMTSKLQAFKRRHPHPSLFYRASHLATGQVAANDTGLNSQNYDHAMPALDTGTSASASTPCHDGDRLLPTTATSPAPIVTIIHNPLREGTERQTTYVMDAEVVLPLSRDEEEPKLCKKILLFGGFIFLLVVVFVFGIVFNLQTEVGIVCISFICGKEKKYLLHL